MKPRLFPFTNCIMDMHDDITAKAEKLRLSLHAKLGVRGKTFSRAIAKAGHLLPRRIRNFAKVIIRAQELGAHPKMMARVDHRAVNKAFDEISRYLGDIDPKEQQRTRLLRGLGGAAFNVIIVAGFFLIWLIWSGNL